MTTIEEVVNDNMKMVYKIFNSMFPNKQKHMIEGRLAAQGFTEEDIIQEGVLGLIKAYHKYDKSSGNKFSTLAYTQIRFAIMNKLNKDHLIHYPNDMKYEEKFEQARNVISSHARINDTDDLYIEDMFFDESINIDENLTKEDVKNAINQLVDKERYVVSRTLNGESHDEISIDMGYTRQYISHLNSKGMQKLRVKLKDYKELAV